MTETQKKVAFRPISLAMVAFENILSPDELPRFRGAVIRHADMHPLFHNHVDSGYAYRYPLIQYKYFDGHPAILGIEEGASVLKELFYAGQCMKCRIGRRDVLLKVASRGEWQEEAGLSDGLYSYAIEDWLPLNARNFHEYQEAEGMIDRISLLQRVLVGNILSFAKGMGLFFTREVKCLIQQISTDNTLSYKGIDLLGFSVSFKTNVRLPQWVGLGKSASQNHGTIIHI